MPAVHLAVFLAEWTPPPGSALAAARNLQRDDLVKMGTVLLAFILLFFAIRYIAHTTNKLVFGMVTLLFLSIGFSNWVYNRNEPRFLTPVIDKIAPFLPAAGSYAAKQATSPKVPLPSDGKP